MSPKPSGKFKSRPICLKCLKYTRNKIFEEAGERKMKWFLKCLSFSTWHFMEDSVCLFLLCAAHSSHPGVLEPLHVAVRVCPGCDLVRHAHVPHCPGSPGDHVLLHPEVLPSRIPVRAHTITLLAMEISPALQECFAELQCRGASCLNSVLSRLWHCLQVGQIHYSGNVSFYKCLCWQLFKQNFWEV